MAILYLCCNTVATYIYIITVYFVFLCVTTSSIHVSLSIEQASCIQWYINPHWFSSTGLDMSTRPLTQASVIGDQVNMAPKDRS